MSTQQQQLDGTAGEWSENLDVPIVADGSMTVPGRGDPGPNCGIWMPKDFCDGCAEPGFGPSTCGRRSCPDCAPLWTRDRSAGVATRLGAARIAADEGGQKRVVHAQVSPPEGEITTLQDVWSGFSDAYGLAKEQGVRGGVAIFHGYRTTDETDRRYQDADTDVGKWIWLLERCDEDWRSMTYWSPHWHVLGLSAEFAENDPDAQDGWVATRIRSLDRLDGVHDRDGINDMIGAARYVLSHATFETDSTRDCVRWFGECATTKLSPEDAIGEKRAEVLERVVDDVVGGDRGEGEDDQADCECENCGSTSRSPIWDAGAALMNKRWCKEVGRQQQRRLQTAFEWAIGEIEPPPGMGRPDTEERCMEVFAQLL